MRNNVIFVDFSSARVTNSKFKNFKKKKIFASFFYKLKKIFSPTKNSEAIKCQVYQFKNIL